MSSRFDEKVVQDQVGRNMRRFSKRGKRKKREGRFGRATGEI